MATREFNIIDADTGQIAFIAALPTDFSKGRKFQTGFDNLEGYVSEWMAIKVEDNNIWVSNPELVKLEVNA